MHSSINTNTPCTFRSSSCFTAKTTSRAVRPLCQPINAFLSNFLKPAQKKSPSKRETIVLKPSYSIPAVLFSTAGLSHFAAQNDILAGLTGILGVFLAIQASRVKFVFDDEALEVVIGEQQKDTENIFVGGQNRWKYSTFSNWEFWWPNFPVLVYFKETQTKPEGQIHFFPIIFDGKQLYDLMVERCGPSMTSGPK